LCLIKFVRNTNNPPSKTNTPQKYLKVKNHHNIVNTPHIVIQTKFWYNSGSPKTLIGNQVKNLLIILSILFLSSPVIGQSKKTGVLYQYKTSSGFVWKTFGKGKVQPKYKGEISNGTPEGLGVLSYPFADGKRVIGEWKEGKEWNTEHYKKDGKVIGKWVNGVKVEKSILFRDTPRSKWVKGGEKWFRSGDEKKQAKYEGEIVTGVPNGWGTITFPSGSMYVGEFRDGKRTGQGTMSFLDGRKYKGKYEGKWKDGRKNGQGTETYPSGRKYEGEWKNNKPWEGTSYDENGNIMGKWVNGKWIKQ